MTIFRKDNKEIECIFLPRTLRQTIPDFMGILYKFLNENHICESDKFLTISNIIFDKYIVPIQNEIEEKEKNINQPSLLTI